MQQRAFDRKHEEKLSLEDLTKVSDPTESLPVISVRLVTNYSCHYLKYPIKLTPPQVLSCSQK